MDNNTRGPSRNPPNHGVGGTMRAFERARAVEGMNQAMMLGNLAIKAFDHVRNSLKTLRPAAGRGVVLR
jgi:hypothetical protein